MPKEPTSGAGAQAGQDAAPRKPESTTTAAPAPAGERRHTAGARDEASPAARGHVVGERKKRFLVAPRAPLVHMGPLGMLPLAFQPVPLAAVEQALRATPGVEIVGIIGARRGSAQPVEGARHDQSEGVLVAQMTDQQANDLHMQGQGRLLVERDQHLQLFEPPLRQPDMVAARTTAAGKRLDLAIRVLDAGGAPVPFAEVSLFGSLQTASGLTGQDGTATIAVYGESPHTIRGLYIRPNADFWSLYQRDPDLSASEPNLVTLRPLSDWRGLAGFPAQNTIGWGQRAMRMDQLPPAFRGRGVKIAVIDSGADTGHANLHQVGPGFSLIGENSAPEDWKQDQLGHGTHCCGVIGGADPTFGIRGFAPEAEIHVCKLLPGGQVSQLIEALEYCIEHQIDVVNLSLGVSEASEALERQILRAKRFGVACIAATGDSGGAVQYPASSPHVLAVAAIGKAGEFPPDSYHTRTMNGDVDAEGYFSATFSCHGPRVDVCAPGVAIVSSVPPNNFAAWDGTSVAAPHITGLAALVLAHHPAFQGAGRVANADRVERLFQVIRMSARPVTRGEPARIGYGMPDALVALGWSVIAPERSSLPQAIPGVPGTAGIMAMGGLGSLGGLGGLGGLGAGGGMGRVAEGFGQQFGSLLHLPFGIGGGGPGW